MGRWAMTETIQSSYHGLLARIALWSLVSLPCVWVPLFAEVHYPTDASRLGSEADSLPMVACFGVPFLGFAAIISVRSLVEVHRILRSYPRGHRYALNAIALTLSVPTIAAAGLVVLCFVLTLIE